jgi:cytochrome c-type biogenesis protein CcmF
MIAELGHYALVLALALALIQSSSPVIGARKGDVALMKLAESTALAQFTFVALALGALTICYVMSDFSVTNVYENSHSQMPLIYKSTSVWGNHEGSMLLWVLILAIFGALVAVFGGNLPATLKANVLAVQSWIASACYLFILFTSSPFRRLAEVPVEGRDLNPILQDFGLAVHLPCSISVMSASLIGHLGSSTFRLPTTATVSMSLTGSRFSSESAPGPLYGAFFVKEFARAAHLFPSSVS